jgi:hypothetical protein
MLVKSFINKQTANELLAWANTQNLYRNQSIGQYGFYTFLNNLDNHPVCLNEIRKKCQDLIGGIYQEPIYKDFVNEVFVDGFVYEHTDPTVKGYKHLRCNIMLQKPKQGGKLVFNKQPVDLEIGDMFVVNTSIMHAVSIVKGDLSYKTIVFGFLCNE